MGDLQQPTTDKPSGDDIYLRMLDIEQKHTATRWTVATFFLNVSFVICAVSFSLDPKQPLLHRIVLQALAVFVYWFAVLILERFSYFTDVLRTYLLEMESSKQTTLAVQTRSNARVKKGRIAHARHLMIGFGILYTVLVVVAMVLTFAK